MQLNVTQAFTLVATSDVAGRRLGPQRLVSYGVAGAVLTDLGIAGRIAIDPEDGDRVRIISVKPCGDRVLDGVLGLLAASPTERRVGTWVRHLGFPRLRDEVLELLVEMDLLQHRRGRVLGVAPADRFANRGRRPEDEVVRRISLALQGERPDPVIACVIVLCDGTRVLGKVVDEVCPEAVARIVEHEYSPPVVAGVMGVIRRLRAARVLPQGVLAHGVR